MQFCAAFINVSHISVTWRGGGREMPPPNIVYTKDVFGYRVEEWQIKLG
jgi:hypothetical protein